MKRRYGLIKTSLIDYPQKVAAVVFTHACNFRCPYCHNPELVEGSVPTDFLDREDILTFLHKRRRVLGGVVLTGGEPLLHTDTPSLINEIQALGLAVKLDTNGSFPDRLAMCRPDFVAMDIKTGFSRYGRVLGGQPDPGKIVSKIRTSIRYLIEGAVPHHFRTTMVPGIVEPADFEELIPALQGAAGYLLSGFRNRKTLDPEYSAIQPYETSVLQEVASRLQQAGIPATIHNNS